MQDRALGLNRLFQDCYVLKGKRDLIRDHSVLLLLFLSHIWFCFGHVPGSVVQDTPDGVLGTICSAGCQGFELGLTAVKVVLCPIDCLSGPESYSGGCGEFANRLMNLSKFSLPLGLGMVQVTYLGAV